MKCRAQLNRPVDNLKIEANLPPLKVIASTDRVLFNGPSVVNKSKKVFELSFKFLLTMIPISFEKSKYSLQDGEFDKPLKQFENDTLNCAMPLIDKCNFVCGEVRPHYLAVFHVKICSEETTTFKLTDK